jgi:hypothetical protein
MRTRIVFLLAALSIALSTMGSDCINSPWLVSVDLDPLGDCYTVNTGDGTWNDVSDPIDINDLIDDTFEQDVTAFRLYDIRVHVTDNYPDGTVGGTVSYAFDFGATQQILSFSGPSSSFKGEGVSLLDPEGLITYDQDVLDAFVQGLNNESFRPNSVTLSSEGSGPPVPPQTRVCVDLYLKADAEGN